MADANLLACALEWFDLADHLGLPFLMPESTEVVALLYVEAAKGYLSVAWTTAGPVFRVAKRPPGYSPAAVSKGLPA